MEKAKKLALNNGFEYREQIKSRGNGLTVLAYLTRNHRHSSRVDWLGRLEAGQILIDERRIGPDAILKNGQLLLWRRPPWDEPDAPLFYSILHEDEDLLAVAKPCGLPTLPAGGFLEHTLLALVRKNHPEANPLHRLGRGTSGVVLFARTARAGSSVCAAWRRKEVSKIYRGLATGCPAEDNFIIEAPIGPVPHPKIGTVNAACPDGKFAMSRVSVLERRGGVSLLEIRIETGRPHQIRIHLAFAGYPLVGDRLYAAGGTISDPETLPGDTGYLLHAERLCFSHPATGLPFEIQCPPPPELCVNAETSG
ncbi:MAG: RluA family pseudouridine synthase [Syntrophobacteraceae bacterium]